MRKIIHVDMDAFFAAVEQRENPELRGKPVIVGGRPQDRGVVATCSYEARKFGIHSAMATSRALYLCPDAILVEPHFELYMRVSHEINSIFHEYTDLVETLSIDEAYLDVTDRQEGTTAYRIAMEIKKKICLKTGLTASAGVSYNKFLAKVASGYKKPDGITVVTPEDAQEFIDKLPVGSFYGVGKVTEKRMLDLGIKTGSDLRKMSLEDLENSFGSSGGWFYSLARGIDESPVTPYYERKSAGREITLPQDILDTGQIRALLENISEDEQDILKSIGEEKGARTVTLKVKYFDFSQITRSITLPGPVYKSDDIYKTVLRLLEKTEAGKKKIRLVGISMSNFGEKIIVKKPEKKPDEGLLPFPE
ncbi:MAG: DNA polymerase IV [Brevinematales bacterium]|jgi:DNA polymerase-4